MSTEVPTVELLVDARAAVGEEPFWHASEQVLYWVDIMGRRIHCYDPARGEDTAVDVGQPVGPARPRERRPGAGAAGRFRGA